MKIEFEKDYLKELYLESKTSDRKKRFQPQVIKQYVKTVNKLKNAKNAEDLYQQPSLRYEKKSGNLSNIEAVWVNDQYRLEFISREEGEEPNVIVICSLTELSNHYKH